MTLVAIYIGYVVIKPKKPPISRITNLVKFVDFLLPNDYINEHNLTLFILLALLI